MEQPKTRIIETERLLLEEITPELYGYVLNNYSDEEIKKKLCINDDRLELLKERKKKGHTNYHTTFKYFLLLDKELKNTIGTCGFFRWYQEHDRAEFGYEMSDLNYREKGLMKEAAQRLIKFGFEEMNIHRIEAFASPTNEPSIKILTGLGMQHEGLMKEHYKRGDTYEDSACYAIMKHEYKG